MKVMAVDVSTKAGVCVAEMTEDGGPALHEVYEVRSPKDVKGIARAEAIALLIEETIDQHEPDLIVFEGYGFSFKGSAIVSMEIGTLCRYFAHRKGVEYIEPSPSTVKQFMAGHGKADKKMMIAACKARTGYTTKSDNEADAVGLALFGLAVKGLFKLCYADMEPVRNFINPPPKKAKAKTKKEK